MSATLQLTDRTRLEGELLAVADSALIIRATSITVVRYPSISTGEFRQVGYVRFRSRPPSNRDREHLRLVSRFPQGLGPELMERLLQAYGQSEPTVY